MNPQGSFIDLRLNRQDGQNQDSFWPSFTDIMTVIVMIFMISMVVLLLRNIELVNQLRATMEAERTAIELARSTGEEKEDLALRLIAAENELSMMRVRLMQMEEQRQTQVSTIGSQSDTITQLQAAKENLELRQKQLSAEKFALEQRLKRANTTIAAQQQNLDTLQQNLESTQQQLASSQQQLTSSQEQLTNTQQQLRNYQQQLATLKADLSTVEGERDTVEEQLSGLQVRLSEQSLELAEVKNLGQRSVRELSMLKSDYDALRVKYNKLVRPARSPQGHYLVSVRYTKSEAGKLLIEYQTEEAPGYSPVSLVTLEQHLDQLKKEKSNGLYIKLIFPEKSGLSHAEAWNFQSRLNRKYDYYYQDGGPAAVPIPDAPGE
ncbi:MAG: hypothetical protein RPU52_12800 [Candidatus Sedimenticola sp. (ex Thyasira tokunagai)]